MLKSGGNAADAAIAGALVLGIAEPQMTGIGGDCFVLVKPAGSEEIVALNGSGRAPKGLNAADLRARGLTAMPIQAIEAVTLPGAIDAFCRLNADYGLKPLRRRPGPRHPLCRGGRARGPPRGLRLGRRSAQPERGRARFLSP